MVKESIDQLIAKLGDLKASDDPEFILDEHRQLDEGEVACIALIEAGEGVGG